MLKLKISQSPGSPALKVPGNKQCFYSSPCFPHENRLAVLGAGLGVGWRGAADTCIHTDVF